MALENVGSFQYLMYKRHQEKLNLALKLRALNFLIMGTQMALEMFVYFDPCVELWKYICRNADNFNKVTSLTKRILNINRPTDMCCE